MKKLILRFCPNLYSKLRYGCSECGRKIGHRICCTVGHTHKMKSHFVMGKYGLEETAKCIRCYYYRPSNSQLETMPMEDYVKWAIQRFA